MEKADTLLSLKKGGESPIKKKLKSSPGKLTGKPKEKEDKSKRTTMAELRSKKAKKIIADLQKHHMDPIRQELRLGIYLVSVGKSSFEKDRLLATVRLFNTHFDFILVLMADSLQRFNLAAFQTKNGTLEKEGSRQEAIKQKAKTQLNEALKAGERWKQEAQKVFEVLMPNRYAFLTWEQLKGAQTFHIDDKQLFSDKSYLYFLNKVHWQEAFSTAEKTIQSWETSSHRDTFFSRLSNSILEYRQRKQKDLEDTFDTIAEYFDDFCREYLKEECQVLAVIAQCLASKGFHSILYPNDGASSILNFAIEQFSQQYSTQDSSALLNWIPFHFKNRFSTQEKISSPEEKPLERLTVSKVLFEAIPARAPLSSTQESKSFEKEQPFQPPLLTLPPLLKTASLPINPGKAFQGFFHQKATLPNHVPPPEEAAQKALETVLGEVTTHLKPLKSDTEYRNYLLSFMMALSSSVQNETSKYQSMAVKR